MKIITTPKAETISLEEFEYLLKNNDWDVSYNILHAGVLSETMYGYISVVSKHKNIEIRYCEQFEYNFNDPKNFKVGNSYQHEWMIKGINVVDWEGESANKGQIIYYLRLFDFHIIDYKSVFDNIKKPLEFDYQPELSNNDKYDTHIIYSNMDNSIKFTGSKLSKVVCQHTIDSDTDYDLYSTISGKLILSIYKILSHDNLICLRNVTICDDMETVKALINDDKIWNKISFDINNNKKVNKRFKFDGNYITINI